MNRFHQVWNAHPTLVSWLLLAVAMVAIVLVAARDVGFSAGQWTALIAATVALAGLCVWIISWEDETTDERIDQE